MKLMKYVPKPLLWLGFWRANRRESLPDAEASVLERMRNQALGQLPRRRLTAEQYVVGMVGLVGSGKSSVAEALARRIGAVVVSADEVRLALRREKAGYDLVRRIVERIAFACVQRGASVVIDSDHVDREKREALRVQMAGTGTKLVFVRSVCGDDDVAIARAITASYASGRGTFFAGAKCGWRGSDQRVRGATVCLREMHRRKPRHYRWLDEGGGRWELRPMPFSAHTIDTADEGIWPARVDEVAASLGVPAGSA